MYPQVGLSGFGSTIVGSSMYDRLFDTVRRSIQTILPPAPTATTTPQRAPTTAPTMDPTRLAPVGSVAIERQPIVAPPSSLPAPGGMLPLVAPSSAPGGPVSGGTTTVTVESAGIPKPVLYGGLALLALWVLKQNKRR